MINSVLEMLEKLATNANHAAVKADLLKAQTIAVQQAYHDNDSHALKKLFCHPTELADKTTVFLQ